MLKTTSYLTLALFLTLAPVSLWAQNSPGTQDPGAPPPPAAEQPNTAAKEAPVKPVEGQIVLQDMGTMLASGMIGAVVYSPSNEWIGDVNDLIIDPTGAVKGVVIGVGGMMGLGEKEVAMDMAKLKVIPSDDLSTAKLVLDSTKEDLAAAPSFKSAAAQIFEKQQQEQSGAQQGANSLAVPGQAPAPQPEQPNQ
jgi:hypothetical protein